MASDTLTFCCPRCSIRLTVPASLAGITGPCPSCRASITAPQAAPRAIPIAPRALPTSPPASVSAAPAPVRAEAASLPAVPLAPPPPVAVPPPEPAAAGEPAVPEGPRIRPEPRHLPERPQAGPIPARHSTGENRLKKREATAAPAPAAPAEPSRLVHALVPAAFSAVAATVVYLLLYFFLPAGPGKKLRDATGPLVVSSRPTAATKTSPDLKSVASPGPGTDSANTPAPPAPDEESPAVVANALLESFLHARDAASRAGMVEPAATEEELAATLLKGPLPEVAQIFLGLPHHDPVEQLTDYPYRVSFVVAGKPNADYAMLVRQRGKQSPKVYLPAFLDLVGGRLAEFTREPNDREPAVFHVILEAVTGCHDESVPEPGHKFTFKLLPSSFGRETARSYVSSGSRFRKMVDDPASSLRWGVRVPATVTLQWNRKEDPAKPYLELIDINSLNWNP